VKRGEEISGKMGRFSWPKDLEITGYQNHFLG